MKVGDVFVALGFKVDDRGLRGFDSGVKNLRLNVALTAAAFTGALYAIDRFVQSSVRGATAMMNFQTQTGLSMEELQRWQNAATLSNTAISVDQVTAAVTGLQSRLADIQLNGGGQAFQRLGISTIGKDAFKVLGEIRARANSVPRSILSNLIQEMGLPADFINVLTEGQEKFDKDAGAFNRSAAMQRQLAALGVQISIFKKNLDLIQSEIVVKLIPAFEALIGFLSSAASLIARLADNLQKIWNMGPEAQNGLKMIAAGFALISLRVAPLTASIAALLLLMDDLATYAAGGDSVTGRVFNFFKDDKKVLDNPLARGIDDLMYKINPPPVYRAPYKRPKTNKSYAGDTPFGNYNENGEVVDANGNVLAVADEGGDDSVPGSTAADVPDGQLPTGFNMPKTANITINNNIATRDDPDAIARAMGASSGQAVTRAMDQLRNGAKN